MCIKIENQFNYQLVHCAKSHLGFSGGTVVKNPPDKQGNTRDEGSVCGSGRSPGGGNDNPLQYSCLGNPMDTGAWWATVHGVTEDSDMTQQISNNKNYFYLPVTTNSFSLCVKSTNQSIKGTFYLCYHSLYISIRFFLIVSL